MKDREIKEKVVIQVSEDILFYPFGDEGERPIMEEKLEQKRRTRTSSERLGTESSLNPSESPKKHQRMTKMNTLDHWRIKGRNNNDDEDNMEDKVTSDEQMDEDREEDKDSQKSEKEDIKRIKRGQVIQMSEEEKMEIKEGDEDGAMKVDDEQEIQNGEYESEIKDSGKRRTGKNRLQRMTGGNRSPRKQRGRELVDTEDEESGLEEDSRDGTEGKTTESKEEGQVPLEEKEEKKIPSGKNEGSGSSKDQENKQLPPDSELEGETEWEEPPEEKSKSTETEVPKEIGRQANQEVSMGNIEQEVTTTKPPVDSMDDESVETQKRGGGTLDDDGPELEDDDNTVSSMQTFHRNSSKQADTVIEVPTIRYSFNFNLMEADIKALEKEFKKKGVPNEKTDTLLRMRNIFIELLKIAKEIDPNSDLLPWHAEEGDEKMGVVKGKEEEIPKTASALSTYFFNLQAEL